MRPSARILLPPARPLIQNYGAPWHIVRAIEEERGTLFALDCCAEKWSAKAPRYITKRQNGLRVPWEDETWCHPEYKTQARWLARARMFGEMGLTVVCLVLASTSAEYWRPLVFESGTTDFYEGRIAFIDPVTKKPKPGFDRASALVTYGPAAVPGLVRTRSARTGHITSIVGRGPGVVIRRVYPPPFTIEA